MVAIKIGAAVKAYLKDEWGKEHDKGLELSAIEVEFFSKIKTEEILCADRLAKLSYVSSLINSDDSSSELELEDDGLEARWIYKAEQDGLNLELKLEIDYGAEILFLTKLRFYQKFSDYFNITERWDYEKEDPILCNLRDVFGASIVYEGRHENFEIHLREFSQQLSFSLLDEEAKKHFKGHKPDLGFVRLPLTEKEEATIHNGGYIVLTATKYSDNLGIILDVIDL